MRFHGDTVYGGMEREMETTLPSLSVRVRASYNPHHTILQQATQYYYVVGRISIIRGIGVLVIKGEVIRV